MPVTTMPHNKLKALTFLAPGMLPVYQFMIDTLARQLDCNIQLETGHHYDEVLDCDLAFICGLPYILYTRPYLPVSKLQALVAPVLQGERFQNRPVYFSDVIVRADSGFYTFADLRGRSWAYNEPLSQSGYGITRYHLLCNGEVGGFFGRVIEAGFHDTAIAMVANGEVDAAAIDVQVLMQAVAQQPQLKEELRIIEALGPSTIQPLAAASHLPRRLRQQIQDVLVDLHHDPVARAALDTGFIDRWTRVCDADYNDIRRMVQKCQRADFMIVA